MKKLEILTVAAILVLAFSLRLYKLNAPIADWHSWRQADTAAVARNFVKDNFNILYPQSDSLTPLNQYGLLNPNRYFINEFPLYNAIVALLYKMFGVSPALARLVSISFATLGTLFLYLLAKKLFSQKIALLATLFYAVNPYNVYYGRVVMPDPMYIAFSIAALYFFVNWVDSKKILYAITSAACLSLAVLAKPYALFLFIPIIFWLFTSWGITAWRNKQLLIFSLISLTPFLLWRIHVLNNPEGTFATTWLYNAGDIRFTGAFFRWLIFERLNRIIFATGAFVLFVLGFIKSTTTKSGLFVFSWLLAVAVYMTVFAKGNVTHDYYQLPLLPAGSILVSLGFFQLLALAKNNFSKLVATTVAVSLLVVSFAFGWYEVKAFFSIDHPEIVTAGIRADALLPKQAMVIAPYNNDPTFLYQTNRHGYSNMPASLKKAIAEGVEYLVSNEPESEQIKKLSLNCTVIDRGSLYIILKLDKNCI